METIQTKIAKILSDTTVVLAAGSAHGVRQGMGFVIYELGETIFDPETAESLGRLELLKGKVCVDHVMPQMSIASTPTRRETRTISTSIAHMFERQITVDVPQEPLNVEGSSDEYMKERAVRVGDLARSVDG